MGDHAVVGAHRLALDVPTPLEHLDGLGHAEREPSSSSRNCATWPMVGRYDEQDAARAQRALCVLHDPPGLGQVEQDPVESSSVDALVDVADLDGERQVGAEERLDVARARPAKSSRSS